MVSYYGDVPEVHNQSIHGKKGCRKFCAQSSCVFSSLQLHKFCHMCGKQGIPLKIQLYGFCCYFLIQNWPHRYYVNQKSKLRKSRCTEVLYCLNKLIQQLQSYHIGMVLTAISPSNIKGPVLQVGLYENNSQSPTRRNISLSLH